MSGEVFKMTELAGSGRAMLARPYGPDNAMAVPADIDTIAYAAHVKGNATPFTSGSLTVADVLLDTPVAWDVDDTGYTFIWPAPGTLWPTAGTTYRIIVTFTPSNGDPAYLLVWEVRAIAPEGE